TRGPGGALPIGPHEGASMHPDGEQLLTVSPTRARKPEPDEICAQAVDLARAAAPDMAGPDRVGEHIGADAEGDRVVTHLFACLDPAYRGWRWAVTVTRASRAKSATVSESVLLPGPESILAPEWVPWRGGRRPRDRGGGGRGCARGTGGLATSCLRKPTTSGWCPRSPWPATTGWPTPATWPQSWPGWRGHPRATPP